jgi:hypothetical protein
MSELLLGRAWPTTVTSHAAGIARRTTAAQQGAAPPGRSTQVEEIVAVMHVFGDSAHGRRLRGLIAIPLACGIDRQRSSCAG